MGRKYIKQQIVQNFVYPNNEKDEYDVEIVHDINNNCVSGNVVTLSATTVNSTGITLSYNFQWNANGAELFKMEDNNYSYVSLHMMAPSQVYMKPYRVVFNVESSTLYTSTTTFSGTTVVTPSQLGLSSLPSGVYYYEVRFIGHRCLYPVCGSITANLPTPTPTPTPTITPTPTPTPTGPTPTPTATPTPTPGGGELYVYAKYVNSSDELGYTLNGGPYTAIGTVPTTNCDYLAVITGVTNGDQIIFETLLSRAIAGDPSTCPSSGYSCTYTHNQTGTGANYVYLSIDGSQAC